MLWPKLFCVAFQLHSALTLSPWKFINVSYDSNGQFVSSMKSWLSPEGYLNMDVHLTHNLSPGMRTLITVQYQFENSMNYQTLLSYDVDTCKTLKDLVQNRLTSIWFRNIRKYGNLSSICPMPAGYLQMRNFRLEDKSIPVYLRAGSYRLKDMNFYAKGKAKAKQRQLVFSIVLQLQLH